MKQGSGLPAGGTPGLSSTPESVSHERETGIKGKLLIVDDEPAIRWALRKTLAGT